MRRTFLADMGMGFAGLAMASMLHRDGIVRVDIGCGFDVGRHRLPFLLNGERRDRRDRSIEPRGLLDALPIRGHRLRRELGLCVSDAIPPSRATEVVRATLAFCIHNVSISRSYRYPRYPRNDSFDGDDVPLHLWPRRHCGSN